MVCLLAALWVQLSVMAGNGWPHNALRHHCLIVISCHWQDCKALLVKSLTHVSGAVASAQNFIVGFNITLDTPHYLHLATSEMWCRLEEGEYWRKKTLCYSNVYYYNGAERYEQFLEVGRLYQTLILLGLVPCLPSASVFRLHGAILIFLAYILLFTF